MPTKKMPEDKIRDILIIDKFEDMKLIFSEKHNKILNLLMKSELSISDMARILDMNPGSVHYHLKDLEKHGLVMQVRDEIKGGVVKKYYRSTARHIVLESPDFNSHDDMTKDPSGDYLEKLIKSIEYLGYHLPSDNLEDANDLLIRYDKRIKTLYIELQSSGLQDVEDNGFVLERAFQLILNIKAKNDPELNRIHGEFEKLFLKYE